MDLSTFAMRRSVVSRSDRRRLLWRGDSERPNGTGEDLQSRRLVSASVSRTCPARVVPGLDESLRVRHEAEDAAGGVANAGDSSRGAVGIARVILGRLRIRTGVLKNDLTGVFRARSRRLASDIRKRPSPCATGNSIGSENVTNGDRPGRGRSLTQRSSNRPDSLAASVVGQDVPPGSRPARTSTWNPLQMPRSRPPRSWNRRSASPSVVAIRVARMRPAPKSSPYENPPGIVRIWKRSSDAGDSITWLMCQVSARAPARSSAYAASSSQFVPGARNTIARGAVSMKRSLI